MARKTFPSKAGVAQTLVHEVHTTFRHLLAYVCVFAALGFGALELLNGAYLERAAAKLLAATGKPSPEWMANAQPPGLRGRQ